MTTTSAGTTPATRPAPSKISLTPTRSTAEASRTALRALILRDLTVLKKHFGEFVARTVIQPFLLVFVFLFVFPRIGQGVGGGHGRVAESQFATVLVPGVVVISIMFQGIQAVALQMSTEFGYTREIEDRVQAPCPIWLVAGAKVLSGAVQGLLAAAIVFPIAAVVHARTSGAPVRALADRAHADPAGVHGDDLAGAAARHHVRAPQHRPDVRLRGAAADVPRWHLLPVDQARAGDGDGIHWLQIVVLINPLIYVTEGMRAGLTHASHMPLYVDLPGAVRVRRAVLDRGAAQFQAPRIGVSP